MVTSETIDNLMAACEQASQPNSHIPVVLDDFLGLVELAGDTADEGYRLAFERLSGKTVDHPLALEAESLKRLLEQAADNL